jgi:hypothetical protein
MDTANNNTLIIERSIFKIGSVLSVSGRDVRIKVDKEKNLPHIFFNGRLIRNVSVGSYVKVVNGFEVYIAKVESELIEEDNTSVNSNYTSYSNKVVRTLKAVLIGHMLANKFEKGIKYLPLIGNEAFILNTREFNAIHKFTDNEDDDAIEIGAISNDDTIRVKLGVQKLFSSHIGIFGNTGSGKSYTLAKLYNSLFEKYRGINGFKQNSKFLFIDFNGEYSGNDVMTSEKKVYKLSTRHRKDLLPLGKQAIMNLDTLCIFASATEKTQRPFISRSLDLYKWLSSSGNDDEEVSKFQNQLRKQIKKIFCLEDKSKIEPLLDYVKAIVPALYEDDMEVNLTSDISYHATHRYYYLIAGSEQVHNKQLNNFALERNHNGELIESTLLYQQVAKYTKPESFIKYFIHIMYLKLIDDVLCSRTQNEHVHPAIQKLKSMTNNISSVLDFTSEADFWGDNNIVVIDLRDTNQDTKKMIPLLLCHNLYKQHTSEHEEPSHLNFIIDEAHNILSYQSNRESDSWKDYRLEVFEEIIKEGRKFGVFMTIASQRPSDISSTIVSQLHNYFIHRLVNDEDLEKVGTTISYLDKVSKESLPMLPTGVCVVAGQLVEMPIIVAIDNIDEEHKPHNETLSLLSKWKSNN